MMTVYTIIRIGVWDCLDTKRTVTKRTASLQRFCTTLITNAVTRMLQLAMLQSEAQHS